MVPEHCALINHSNQNLNVGKYLNKTKIILFLPTNVNRWLIKVMVSINLNVWLTCITSGCSLSNVMYTSISNEVELFEMLYYYLLLTIIGNNIYVKLHGVVWVSSIELKFRVGLSSLVNSIPTRFFSLDTRNFDSILEISTRYSKF